MARSSRKKTSTFADRFDSLRAGILGDNGRFASIAAGVVLVALVGLVWWGIPKLRHRLREQSMSTPSTAVVSYTALPAWFDDKRQSQVSARVLSAVGDLSSIDQTRLSRARDAMMSTGWFDVISQIRLADGGGFLVDATFLRPFAIVRHGEFDFLVTPEGRLMPMDWPAGHRPAAPHYVALLGASQPAPAAQGDIWPGADVAAGLELVRAISGEKWFSLVAGIELSHFTSEKSLILITRDGGRLIWGRAPDDRSVAEVPTETKLSTLTYLFHTSGRIDSGGGRILDLRGDLVTVRAEVAEGSVGNESSAVLNDR